MKNDETLWLEKTWKIKSHWDIGEQIFELKLILIEITQSELPLNIDLC